MSPIQEARIKLRRVVKAASIEAARVISEAKIVALKAGVPVQEVNEILPPIPLEDTLAASIVQAGAEIDLDDVPL